MILGSINDTIDKTSIQESLDFAESVEFVWGRNLPSTFGPQKCHCHYDFKMRACSLLLYPQTAFPFIPHMKVVMCKPSVQCDACVYMEYI